MDENLMYGNKYPIIQHCIFHNPCHNQHVPVVSTWSLDHFIVLSVVVRGHGTFCKSYCCATRLYAGLLLGIFEGILRL
jgi:hypothetical protein